MHRRGDGHSESSGTECIVCSVTVSIILTCALGWADISA